MESKFFTEFLLSYIVVLGGITGWFIIMFHKAKQLAKRINN